MLLIVQSSCIFIFKPFSSELLIAWFAFFFWSVVAYIHPWHCCLLATHCFSIHLFTAIIHEWFECIYVWQKHDMIIHKILLFMCVKVMHLCVSLVTAVLVDCICVYVYVNWSKRPHPDWLLKSVFHLVAMVLIGLFLFYSFASKSTFIFFPSLFKLVGSSFLFLFPFLLFFTRLRFLFSS